MIIHLNFTKISHIFKKPNIRRRKIHFYFFILTLLFFSIR